MLYPELLHDYDSSTELNLDDSIAWDILRYRDIDNLSDLQIRRLVDTVWNTLPFHSFSKKNHRKRYREVVKNHILNLVRAFMMNCNIRISRDHNNWYYIERYFQIHTTKNYVIRSLDELLSNGWIELFPGFYCHEMGKGKQTRIRPSSKLKKLFTQISVIKSGKLGITKAPVKESIQLRHKIDDKQYKLVPYDDTPMTRQMRFEIDRYSDFVSKDRSHLTLSRSDLTGLNPDHLEVIDQLLIDGLLSLNIYEMSNRPHIRKSFQNRPKIKPQKPSMPDNSSGDLMEISSIVSNDNNSSHNTQKEEVNEEKGGVRGIPITQTLTEFNANIQKHISNPYSLARLEKEFYSVKEILRAFPRIRKFIFRVDTPKLYHAFSAKNKQFRLGGRIFGDPIQRLPKWIRKKICFGRTVSIELDYKSLHPTMLYIMASQTPPQEIYLISKHDNPQLREEHKTVLLCAINHDNPNNLHQAVSRHFQKEFGYKKGDTRLKKDYITAIYQDLVEHNAPIRKFLNTGIGLKLMRKDATIAMRIINDLMKLGIQVRCIHDSFIVPVHHKNTLHRLMVEHFKSVMKTEYKIDISGMKMTKCK